MPRLQRGLEVLSRFIRFTFLYVAMCGNVKEVHRFPERLTPNFIVD